MSETVEILVDGRPLRVAPGTTVAAALFTAEMPCRWSVRGEPRAPLCGMGVCYECRLTIDDVPQRRACLVAVAPGMRVSTGRRP